jgi:hemerythrin-like domain-containing protein
MLIAELELAIGEYRHGDSAAVDRFVEAANLYRNHMVGHMREEDAILFRLAEEVLDEAGKASLTQSFGQEEAQDCKGTVARYERLAQELEKNWAV